MKQKKKVTDILQDYDDVRKNDANKYLDVFLQSLNCSAWEILPTAEGSRQGFDKVIAEYLAAQQVDNDHTRGVRKAFDKLFKMDANKRSAYITKCSAKIIRSQLTHPSKDNIKYNIGYLYILTTLDHAIFSLLNDRTKKMTDKAMKLRTDIGS